MFGAFLVLLWKWHFHPRVNKIKTLKLTITTISVTEVVKDRKKNGYQSNTLDGGDPKHNKKLPKPSTNGTRLIPLPEDDSKDMKIKA